MEHNNPNSSVAIADAPTIEKEIEEVVTKEPVKTEVVILPDEDVEIKVNGGIVYRFLKRTFDIVSSGLFLLVFGWIMLILMFIKWVEDAGAKTYKLDIKPATEKTRKRDAQYSKDGRKWEVKIVPDPNGEKDPTVHGAIYTSIRIGKDGVPFKFHKIRSMCKGAEAMKAQLIEYGINEADDPAFKLKYDPRITRFGYFLRKTSLDELPQIWDVFIGKLAVIGPRSPIGEFEVDNYSPYLRQRLKVKGGLLCLWQIQKNRHSISFNKWVDLDIEYIQKRSLWLDFKILVIGFWRVLTDRSGE
ncbi:MAG: sugar transferase [Bacilli bacterium]|jgi:lipopolysaccharide/colanic/teichoic acid biosynthesis glycosyltransferase|nr:sugar transferase [Bacilli bacterium]